MNTAIIEPFSDAKPWIGNRVTVLIPARQYVINCAWIKERPLPAVELFSCRLLLAFDKLLPSELRDFFGLNDRECEVLIDSLQEKRLAALNHDGFLIPSSLLLNQAKKNDGTPILVTYEEQTERVVFDILALSVRKEQTLNPSMFGLPELPIPEDLKKRGTKEIIDAFGSQFRSYLEISRTQEYERKRTQLYKIMGCQSENMLQIPVDIEFTYQANTYGEPKKWTSSYERLNRSQHRPLSNELESHIADYLGCKQVSESGLDAEEYCRLVDDTVLSQFASGYNLDYSAWLRARHQKKTGYKTSDTTALFGPVYLNENRQTVLKWIHQGLSDVEKESEVHALWLASEIPLWGASAEPLSSFIKDLVELLTKHTRSSHVAMLHHGSNNDDAWAFQNRFKEKIPYGIMIPNSLDKMEILLIPGIFGLVQYHGQPNSDSTITVPLGYMTQNPERLKRLEDIVSPRMGSVDQVSISWPRNYPVADLVPTNWLNPILSTELPSSKQARPILSLKK